MITKSEIIKAYLFLRENNNSISDEVLDFMKHTSLRALEESEGSVSQISDTSELLEELKRLVKKHQNHLITNEDIEISESIIRKATD